VAAIGGLLPVRPRAASRLTWRRECGHRCVLGTYPAAMVDNGNLKTRLEGGALIAEFKGPKIGDFESAPLRADVEKMAPLGGWRVVADLSAVLLLGSSGIGMLVQLKKACDANKGRLVVCGLSDELYGLLKISALLKMFIIKKDVAQAIAAMA